MTRARPARCPAGRVDASRYPRLAKLDALAGNPGARGLFTAVHYRELAEESAAFERFEGRPCPVDITGDQTA